jgi:ADP-ribosyl-[dinitrogen reductase] hydrolase
LALGDALGAPFEFRRAKDIPRPVPAFELPWMGMPPGTTTDDTAMARNLVRSLVDRNGLDPADVAARHLAWFQTSPPDVGTLTRRVLQRMSHGVPAEEAARAIWEERGPEVSAGNGSVMYCAPLGAAYAGKPEMLLDAAPRLSAITHYDGRCRTAVLAVTVALAALVGGESAELAVGNAIGAALDGEGGEELEFLVEAVGGTRPVDGPDMGFCLYAAAIGLQTVAGHTDFAPALLAVMELGGDTDTNGAVAGALMGAGVGAGGLPSGWLDTLRDRPAIEAEARSLARLAAAGPVK